MLERLLNQTDAPLLERVLDFTAQRHDMLADNIANVDTPGYRQKDFSVDKFNQMLQDRVSSRAGAPLGSVGFDDIDTELEHPTAGILSHDGNNRSMEHLTTDLAKNALLHNMIVELLRQQFQTMEMALKDKPG